MKRRRSQDPASLARANLRYKRKHPEKVNAIKQASAARNPGTKAQWYQDNREWVYQKVRARGQHLNLTPISVVDLDEMFQAQGPACPYCGTDIGPGFRHLEHKTPLSRGGEHILENLHYTCAQCNLRKASKTHDEFTGAVR